MAEYEEPHHLIVITSRIEEIGKVVDEVKTFFKKKGYGGKRYRRLIGALYEAMSNAVTHGNREDEKKKVLITYSDEEDKFWIKVNDEGEGFDPTSLSNPCSLENRTKPRGRGIFIIKNFVDEVSFNEKGNEIMMSIKK